MRCCWQNGAASLLSFLNLTPKIIAHLPLSLSLQTRTPCSTCLGHSSSRGGSSGGDRVSNGQRRLRKRQQQLQGQSGVGPQMHPLLKSVPLVLDFDALDGAA